MTAPQKLILASTSKFRKALMENAGLEFQSVRPEIDEREIGDPLEKSGADPIDIAQTLAVAKAMDVSSRHPDTFVIGSDQTMALGKHMFHKPKDRDKAGRHIEILSGKTHSLHSGVAIVQNGKVLWEHVSSAHMTMRILSAAAIETYLEKAGDAVLWSVGAYQLESVGVTLFEKIDGDYFTILGLPMLPLLQALRNLEIIDA